jgi:hypothetical protein
VSASGKTAIAIPEVKHGVRVGVDVALGLTGRRGHALDRPVVQTVDRVLVLTTNDPTTDRYREHLCEDDRIDGVTIYPPANDAAWREIRSLASEYGAVVLDQVQGVSTGHLTYHHSLELSKFPVPVIGLYLGNGTKPGIGSEAGWAFARRRFWIDMRQAQPTVHSLDTDDQPWTVTFADPTGPQGAPVTRPLTADVVGSLADLARSRRVDKRGGATVILANLLTAEYERVKQLIGREPTISKLSQAVSDHYATWETRLAGNARTPLPDDPPF